MLKNTSSEHPSNHNQNIHIYIHTFKTFRPRKEVNRKNLKYFNHLTCKNTFPSLNVSKRKPTCFPFALTLSPSFVRYLSTNYIYIGTISHMYNHVMKPRRINNYIYIYTMIGLNLYRVPHTLFKVS